MLGATACVSRSARLSSSKICTKFCEIQFYEYPSKAVWQILFWHYFCSDCLTTLLVSTNYIASIKLLMNEEKSLERSSRGQIEVMSWYLPGENAENYEKS
jgi:hypothetical protein